MLVKWCLAAAGGLATPLTSDQLLELVPQTGVRAELYRFSWQHALGLLWQPRVQPAAPTPPSAQFDNLTQYELGEHLFYGIGCAQNLEQAAVHYKQAADEGDPDGQFMTGLAYSTGLFGNHAKNEALATLYYTMAAINGAPRGQIAVGYRYLNGFGMPSDPVQAYNYLIVAGDAAFDYTEQCETGVGHRVDTRLDFVAADEFDGGLYGNASSLPYLRRTSLRRMLDQWDSVEEGLLDLKFMAENENKAWPLLFLAQAHIVGSYNGEPDFAAALECAHELIRRSKDDTSKEGRWRNSWAHSFIGNCYRRGEGVPCDLEAAAAYYRKGLEIAQPVSHADAPGGELRKCKSCYNGLGILELNKIGGNVSHPDYERVRELFLCGSLLEHPYSQYMMGRDLYMHQFYTEAVPLLKSATGALPQPYYLLAQIYDSYARTSASPTEMRDLYTNAAESVLEMLEFVQDFYSPMRFAQRVRASNPGAAMAAYLVSAELGITSAQVNLADMLDVTHSWFRTSSASAWPVPAFVKDRASLALRYFSLAGHNYTPHLDSLLKVAEYYFHGQGVPKDTSRAAAIYQALTRQSRNAMAFWSLGWMHEHGLGMIPDFHLAKRYYDSALYYNPNSYIAIQLSLAVLHCKQLVARVLGWNVNHIQPSKSSHDSKSWWQSLWAVKQQLSAMRQAWTLEEEPAPAPELEEDFYGPLMVDTAITVAVLAIVASIIWARQRRRQGEL